MPEPPEEPEVDEARPVFEPVILECHRAPAALTYPIGDRSHVRYVAVVLDNGFAILLVCVLAQVWPLKSHIVSGMMLLSMYLFYFFLQEGLFGTTIGKKLFGLYVVSHDGGRPSWQQHAIRTVFRLFEVNPLLLGGLPAILAIYSTQRRQRFGDLLAKTVVIRDLRRSVV